MLALATNDGLVRLVESRGGEERMRFRARSSRGAHCVALSRDGMKLALGNENLRILNAQNGEELARIEYRVTALTFSPCGKSLLLSLQVGTGRSYCTTWETSSSNSASIRWRVG